MARTARRPCSIVTFFVAAIACTSVALARQTASRERLSLDQTWLFHEGDVPFPVITGHQPSYDNAKSGKAWGAAAPDHDDSAWRTVDVPHDWAVEQPFDPKANLSQGYRARGLGWYRKYVKLDAADRGRHLELQLDGIATHATIWVNGVLAERSWSGYTSSYLDITPYARFGDDVNTIAIRVDAVAQEGWWYEGAGIYRHTWLIKRSPVHIKTDGIFANPVRDAAGKWTIPVEANLFNADRAAAEVEVESTLLDVAGVAVASGKTSATLAPLADARATFQMAVEAPALWSVDRPTMYSVRTVLRRGGAEIDAVTTPCGFRTIRFDAARGFFLNDEPLKIKGTCNHQDMAGVGVAVPDSIWDFRVRRLKEMGSNAYRCSHHAPAKEFLEACDRLGMLVMNETRNFGSAPEYMRQLEWLVRRDRNHPSVFLWSVFNEEPSQGTEMGFEMVRRMGALVKTLDATRPVTAAQSSSVMNAVNASQAADVAGFNYVWRDFDRYHERYPTKPIFSSEDTSTVMTRGVFVTDRARGRLDSYDSQVVSWGRSHREGWKLVAERPFVAGQMVWTGFDYRGEPQPLSWPSTGSSFGILDLCGFPKTAYYIHQAQWISDRPILHVAPHWNWPDSAGKPVKVMVISNAERATLYLNGRSLGEHAIDKFDMLTLDVPYEAGKLEAVATTAGKEVARFAVETTGAPAGLRLVADRPALSGDGADAQPITVEVVDAQGRVVPTANVAVRFAVSGPGAIIGSNNGDPTCHEPEKGDAHSTFNGLAQVIVQSAREGSGALKLTASADGLASGEAVIDVKRVAPLPSVPPAEPTLVVSGWRMSPATATRPDPNVAVGETDMNTWGAVRTGRMPPMNGGRFAIFRAQFNARKPVVAAGGKLTLRDVSGRVEVYVNGKLVHERVDPARATIVIPLPAGVREHTLSVLVEADEGSRSGLGGPATVEGL